MPLAEDRNPRRITIGSPPSSYESSKIANRRALSFHLFQTSPSNNLNYPISESETTGRITFFLDRLVAARSADERVADNSSATETSYARGKGQSYEYISRQSDRYALIICKGGNNNIVVSGEPTLRPEETAAWANNASRGINRDSGSGNL